MCFVNVEIVNEQSKAILFGEQDCHVEIEGEAVLQGFGSAKGDTTENYASGNFALYQGRTLAILRSARKAGKAVLKVKCEGFEDTQLEIEIKEVNTLEK